MGEQCGSPSALPQLCFAVTTPPEIPHAAGLAVGCHPAPLDAPRTGEVLVHFAVCLVCCDAPRAAPRALSASHAHNKQRTQGATQCTPCTEQRTYCIAQRTGTLHSPGTLQCPQQCSAAVVLWEAVVCLRRGARLGVAGIWQRQSGSGKQGLRGGKVLGSRVVGSRSASHAHTAVLVRTVLAGDGQGSRHRR